jgi:hypothetical protein
LGGCIRLVTAITTVPTVSVYLHTERRGRGSVILLYIFGKYYILINIKVVYVDSGQLGSYHRALQEYPETRLLMCSQIERISVLSAVMLPKSNCLEHFARGLEGTG